MPHACLPVMVDETLAGVLALLRPSSTTRIRRPWRP